MRYEKSNAVAREAAAILANWMPPLLDEAP